MGAVKGADAKVDDAGAVRVERIARKRDGILEIGQAGPGKTLHRPGSRRARATICVGLTKRSAISNHTIDVAM